LGGGHELVIEETGVGQKTGVLGVHLHDVVGVAVADVGDVVDAVEDLVAVLFVEVLPLGVVQFEGVVGVGERHHWVQGLLSLIDDRLDFICIFFIEKVLPLPYWPKRIELPSGSNFAG
jgi:hypothetical protein